MITPVNIKNSIVSTDAELLGHKKEEKAEKNPTHWVHSEESETGSSHMCMDEWLLVEHLNKSIQWLPKCADQVEAEWFSKNSLLCVNPGLYKGKHFL